MKRIVVLVGVCVLCPSLECHEQKVAEVGKIKKSKIEIKKEKMCQNKHSRLGTVVC